MSRVALAFLALSAVFALVTGCARTAPSDIQITLDNLTDTPVGLYVNDDWVGTYPAGGSTRQPLGDHGGAPYTVEVRSPSGAVLATVGVNAAQAELLSGGGGRAIALEQGLPCGIVRLVIGELDAGQTLAPADVAPGPCP